MFKRLVFIVWLMIFACLQLEAQSVEIPRLPEPIQFDGKLEEMFWKQMPLFPTTQHVPYNGEKPSEDERIYLAYDDQYLYLAAEIQGANIQSPSRKRDEFSLKPDYIGLIIDSYHDKENALGFLTTPAALRSDFTVVEDAVGGYPINNDWNTFWDVKTEVGTSSWTVEMRIPFSSLQFQDKDGDVEMGLIVMRLIASKNEFDTWPEIENAWGDWSPFKPSVAATVTLKGVKAKKPVYVTPYLLAGASRVVDDKAPFEAMNRSEINAGLDVKYNVTSNLTMDLTLNTDFAQVEADDAQINLDRFNLFFPEKRQFFQERSAIFDLRVGGSSRIFYSRRIGIDDNGRLEKIWGGARLTGRVGDYDVGAINMTTRDDNWNPQTNFSVLRLRKKVVNDNSYVGVIGTNKIGQNGDYNSVYALDGTFRLKGNNIFQVRWAQSFTDGYENNPLSMRPSRFLINLEKFQFSGFTYDLAVGRMGQDYNPEMGFEERGNYTSLFGILGYGWQSAPSSRILQRNVRMYNFTYLNNDTGLDETTNIGAEYVVSWRSGHYFTAFSYFRRERLFEDIEILSGLTIQEGLYSLGVYSLEFGTPEVNQIDYNLQVRGGDYFNHRFLAVEQGVNWVVFPDLTLGLDYNFNPIFIEDGVSNSIRYVQLARLRFLYTLSTELSLSGFLQASSEGNVGLGNIRFRYNPREGVDLFLVYNNRADLEIIVDQADFNRGVPEQVFIAKFSYTFRL